ncbi:MAG: serine/threonine protein kinase [Planctomycetota bacterium]|jgi:serine/threonine-protein kinase
MAKDILKVGGYSIIQRIGTGARSAIYLATNEEDNSVVALKRVILERPEDARIFEQVETEFRVARRIDHPYVRKYNQLKKIRSLFKTREMLLSMEYFDGQSLEEGPTLALVDVLLILIDFGQSCKIGTTKPRIQGTPDYIAPEQVRRKPLGPRTDVFNLGATMYWALTGKNVPTLIPKKRNGLGLVIPKNCPAPHEIRDKVPIGVSRLVMDCIRDNPAERPGDMMTVISRLDLMIHSILGDKIRTNRNASNNH